MPVDRHYTVPEDPQRLPDLDWTEEGDLLVQPRVVRDGDPDPLMQTLLEALAILRRVGGTIQIASQRGEIAPNVIVTESFIVAYNSFTPLVRRLGDNLEALGDPPEPANPEDVDELTQEEIAAHFPAMSEGQIGEAIAAAQDEEPAEAEAAAAVE